MTNIITTTLLALQVLLSVIQAKHALQAELTVQSLIVSLAKKDIIGLQRILEASEQKTCTIDVLIHHKAALTSLRETKGSPTSFGRIWTLAASCHFSILLWPAFTSRSEYQLYF